MSTKLFKPLLFAFFAIALLLSACSSGRYMTASRIRKDHFKHIINSNKVECYVQSPYTDKYKTAQMKKYLKYKN